MGNDGEFVHRYENNEVVSAQVNYPCEASRRQDVVVEENGVLHSIMPSDRDDIAMLLSRLQSSRLLRLAILSHQLDEATSQERGGEALEVATSNNVATAILTEKPITEEEIMKMYRDAAPESMKGIYKYWNGEDAKWKSPHLGKQKLLSLL